jgi:Lrp/AsnC family transcriptional regulator for asnA, asnC and gidA
VILRELQEDGRISYATLSRKTGIPSSSIHDKTKRLISDGVIKKFTVIIDGEKIGLNNIAIIGVQTGAKKFKNVAEKLCEIKGIVEVYETTAEFDLMIKVRAFSRGELSEILNRIRTIDGVDDIYVSSVLDVFKEEQTLPISEL